MSSSKALAATLFVLLSVGPLVAQEPTAPPAPAEPVAAAPAPVDNPVILTVNGEAITAMEVRQMMDGMARSIAQRGQEPEPGQLEQLAIQQIVDFKLLSQEAARREVTVDPEQVLATIAEVETRAGGSEKLDAGLAQMGMTRDTLRASVEDGQRVEVLIETQLRPTVSVSDEELAAFYNDNLERFEEPETVRARHILRTVDEGADEATRNAAKAEAEKARERALAGEDFAALAEELSQGPSASKGGDLGFFSKEQMVEPFAVAAFALEEGGISEVVETRFGYHVIRVEEKKPAGTLSLDEVKDRLRPALEEQKLGEAVEELLGGLREKAEVVPASESAAAPAENG